VSLLRRLEDRLIERVSTGNTALDQQTGGGFPKASLIMVAGEAGTGKTNFTSQYLHAGASQFNEPGVFVSFGEDRGAFYSNMNAWGLDFEKLERQGKFKLLDLITVKSGAENLLIILLKELEELKARRLVIDSFTALSQSLQGVTEQRIFMHTLLTKVLRKMKCTTLVTVEKSSGQPQIGSGIEEFVADGILLLTRDNETGIRRISIPKMRSTKLRQTNFPFTLDHGFHLIPPLDPLPPVAPPTQTTIGSTTTRWTPLQDSKTHFSSGNKQLDEVLGGGFQRGVYVILEIERDVPVKAVRLLEYPLLWNFMSQGRGVVFLRNVRNSEQMRTAVSSCVSTKTFDRLAKVIENRRYGEDQTKPYTVVISGEEKNIDEDMKLFDRVTPRLMKKTGKNVLRLISFAVLENLYARNIEKLLREIGHAITQNRTFGNLTIATARPGLNITPRALNLVDWHLRLIERDGAVLFQGIKPRIGLHAVDADNTSEQMSMRLTPMV
jgi:KaiC/GvpD/RAD55 family RecA-like ATPase